LRGSAYGEETYLITRSELERILQISGSLEALSMELAGTRESLENASAGIEHWSMNFAPALTALGQSLGTSIEQAETLAESGNNSAAIVKSLEESITRYSAGLSRMEKSRNFWRGAALGIAALAAGGIVAALVF
jgi:hypothetical protein